MKNIFLLNRTAFFDLQQSATNQHNR